MACWTKSQTKPKERDTMTNDELAEELNTLKVRVEHLEYVLKQMALTFLSIEEVAYEEEMRTRMEAVDEMDADAQDEADAEEE